MPYENLLSNDERQILLIELERFASDEILLAAVNETQAERMRQHHEMTAIKKKRNSGSPTLLTQSIKVAEEIKIEVTETQAVKFIEPPGEAAARVVTATTGKIMDILQMQKGSTIVELNRCISGRLDNTERVLKLLWKRNLVVFDGVKYFIA